MQRRHGADAKKDFQQPRLRFSAVEMQATGGEVSDNDAMSSPVMNSEGGRVDWGSGADSSLYLSPRLSATDRLIASPLLENFATDQIDERDAPSSAGAPAREAVAAAHSPATPLPSAALEPSHRGLSPRAAGGGRPATSVVSFGRRGLLSCEANASGETARQRPLSPSQLSQLGRGVTSMDFLFSSPTNSASLTAFPRRASSPKPPAVLPRVPACTEVPLNNVHGLAEFSSPMIPPVTSRRCPSLTRRLLSVFCLLNALLAFLFAWMMETGQVSFALMSYKQRWGQREKARPVFLAGVYYLLACAILTFDVLFHFVVSLCWALPHLLFWLVSSAMRARLAYRCTACGRCVLGAFCKRFRGESADAADRSAYKAEGGHSQGLRSGAWPSFAQAPLPDRGPAAHNGGERMRKDSRRLGIKQRRCSPSIVSTASATQPPTVSPLSGNDRRRGHLNLRAYLPAMLRPPLHGQPSTRRAAESQSARNRLLSDDCDAETSDTV